MAEPQTTQPGERPKPNVWMVYDLNQRGDKPRLHDIPVKLYTDGSDPDIVTYKLYRDDEHGCPMPMEHAMKFLCDASFKVVSPTGNRVKPIERIDYSRPISKLGPDEVVVKYEYLSRDYLFKLVKMTPGSEEVKQNATSEELAAFMTKWRNSLVGMTDAEKNLAEMMAKGELGGAMPTEQLETMFPGNARKAA